MNTVSKVSRIRSNQWPFLYLAWDNSIKTKSAKAGCRERQREHYSRWSGFSGDNDRWQLASPNQNRVSMVPMKPGPKHRDSDLWLWVTWRVSQLFCDLTVKVSESKMTQLEGVTSMARPMRGFCKWSKWSYTQNETTINGMKFPTEWRWSWPVVWFSLFIQINLVYLIGQNKRL